MADTGISKRGHRGLLDINHEALRVLMNRSLTDGGTAIDADKNDIKIVADVTYVINGVFYTKSAATGINATITDADDDSTSQAADTTCYYVYCLDTSGNVKVYKGVDGVAQYPAIPSTVAPFAVAKIVVTAAFTLGTTDYDSNATTTWSDVSMVPAAVI